MPTKQIIPEPKRRKVESAGTAVPIKVPSKRAPSHQLSVLVRVISGYSAHFASTGYPQECRKKTNCSSKHPKARMLFDGR